MLPVEFDWNDSIVVVQTYRALTAMDSLLVLQAISNSKWPILLDFRKMNAGIANLFDWVLFVDSLRVVHGQRVALLSSVVGHSTSCHLIALWTNRDDRQVQAFQDDRLARNWLNESR